MDGNGGMPFVPDAN